MATDPERRPTSDFNEIVRDAFPSVNISEVICCPLLARTYVLVDEESLGIAKLQVPTAASRCNCEMVVITKSELDQRIDRAILAFEQLECATPEIAERLASHGFLSFADMCQLTMNPLVEIVDASEDVAASILREAEARRREEL